MKDNLSFFIFSNDIFMTNLFVLCCSAFFWYTFYCID